MANVYQETGCVVPLDEIVMAQAKMTVRTLIEMHEKGEDVSYPLRGGIIEEEPGCIGLISVDEVIRESSHGVNEVCDYLTQQIVLKEFLGGNVSLKTMPYRGIAGFLRESEGTNSFTIPTIVDGLFYHLSVEPSHHVIDTSGAKHISNMCEIKHFISNHPHSKAA